jgi:hypothetical protein
MTMHIFARMTKVDEATRTVTGVIANEALDRSGEVFDYDSSKPHFEKWSSDIATATGGKSVGNVRAMHGNVVAGITKTILFDDVQKTISVDAHIVDDNEWKKTLAGCYTGFSIGGSYGPKWVDPVSKAKRYTGLPIEYSLVDLPCNPDAQFSVIKLDGETEMRKFETPAVTKGMSGVSDLADILSRLGWVAEDAEWEAGWEGDGSKVPADLRDTVKTLGAILVRMATEEAAELAASLGNADKSATGDLSKSDTSHEEKDMNEELQKSFDTATADLKKGADDLAKLHTEHAEALAKIAGERDDLAKKLEAVTAEHAELLKKAAPAKGAARVVGKDDENGTELAKRDDYPVLNKDGSTDYQATALKMMKFVHGR